jgi:hypothetical protein
MPITLLVLVNDEGGELKDSDRLEDGKYEFTAFIALGIRLH